MTLIERALGLLHGTFFLRPLLFAVWYPMLVYMLVANVQPSFYHRQSFYAVFALAMLFFCADRFRQLYYLDRKREEGIHWRALVLLYAKWPYFAHGLWQALRGWSGAFAVTPKTRERSHGGSLAKTHLVLALVMASALVFRVSLFGMPRLALFVSAIGFVLLSLLLVCAEALRFPPQFERGRYASRRATLAERLDRA